MTVLDRLRAALPGSDDPSTADEGGGLRSGAGRGALVGLATGLGSFALVAVPVVLAWLLDPLATGSAWPAVGTGAASNPALVPLAELQAPKVDAAKLNSKKVTELMTQDGLL